MDRSRYFLYPEQPKTAESSSCDIDLIQASQFLMIDAVDQKQASHIARVVIDYLKDCNKTFLATERIRHLLLFSLLTISLIALINITLIPLASASVTLMLLLAVTLFLINVAMTFIQSNHHRHQQQAWNRLKTVCEQSESNYRCKESKLLNPAHKRDPRREKIPEKQQFSPLFANKKDKPDKLVNRHETSRLDEPVPDPLSHLSL